MTAKETNISEHYTHGNLLTAIEQALSKLGKTTDNITIEDLAPVDEFHVGGRQATEHFFSQMSFSNGDQILDVGCGLGGASRYVASQYQSLVTGLDLTPEYIATGNTMNQWVGLDNHVSLHQGSALSLPFENEIFDGGFMMHVGMNINDKAQLFKDVCRTLRPNAPFGIYDIMRTSSGDLTFPVPWSSAPETSYLASPEEYCEALNNAGFSTKPVINRRDFALAFFEDVKSKTTANGGPPALGLHTLIGQDTSNKMKNMFRAITDGHIAPMVIIAQKE